MGFVLCWSGVQSAYVNPASRLCRARAVSVLEGVGVLAVHSRLQGQGFGHSLLGWGAERVQGQTFWAFGCDGSVGQIDTQRGGAAPPDFGRKLRKN